MTVKDTPIDGLKIIEPKIFSDNRGYFFESYNKANMLKKGLDYTFLQDNQSKSSRGVVRGLHYQLPPKAQSKLIRVLYGEIYDVAVDIRAGSPTYGQWFGIHISAENQVQFLIPKGFAHGFSVLSETAIILYKCDEYYSPEHESGIIFNDKELDIDWKLNPGEYIVSDKDKKLASFRDAKK